MTKNNIWILVIIMAIVLLALIGIQAYWISNAITAKEKHFDQLMNRAVADITLQLETIDALHNISNDFSLTADSIVVALTNLYFDSLQKKIDIDSAKLGNKITTQTTSTESEILHKNDSIYKIYVKALMEKRVELIDKFFRNMVHADKEISQQINENQLNKIINSTFFDLGINADFEYAICNRDSSPLITSENFVYPNSLQKSYKRPLIFGNNYSKAGFLIIYFPDNKSYSEYVILLAISSIFLILSIVIVFIIVVNIVFKQRKLSSIKNDFISNMTHELKTPISTISLASQMLHDKTIPIEKKNLNQISAMLSHETAKLSFQVEKILLMSLFQQGEIHIRKTSIALTPFFDEIIEEVTPDLQSRNAKIITRFDESATTIIADRKHLKNALLSIIDNSIKYSKEDLIVEISTFRKNGDIVIVISDNGIGISKEDQKKVFDRFFRVSTGNLHNVKGTGLGLTYAKNLILAHEGKIQLKSEINKGTTIEIQLPLNNDF